MDTLGTPVRSKGTPKRTKQLLGLAFIRERVTTQTTDGSEQQGWQHCNSRQAKLNNIANRSKQEHR